jgi:hypothetical protein
MQEIPEYLVSKPPEKRLITKKDKIIVLGISNLFETKKQIEKEFEELLEE